MYDFGSRDVLKPLIISCLTLFPAAVFAQGPNQADFFESKVRPVLVSRCGSCHGDKTQMGGKQLTTKDGMHRSGVVTPGDPEQSRLIQAVRYAGKIKMPPAGKMPDAEIAALERWVAGGAVWPDTDPAVKRADAAGHWSLQPVKNPPPPEVKDTAWPRSDIDRFILAKLEEKGIHPVADASQLRPAPPRHP